MVFKRKTLTDDTKKPCVLRVGPVRKTLESIGKGTCGTIFANHTTAYKHSNYNNTYWLNEVAIYKYMENSYHPCVMKPTNINFMKDHAVYEMKRYVRDLEGYKILSEYHMLMILLQLSSAIKYIHEHGIIHRDIKPANVLMDSAGNVILTDFSHSVIETCKATLFYPNVTSFPYRAPEVYAYQRNESALKQETSEGATVECVTGSEPYSEDYDAKIDVWSFGALFLEILCQLRFDLLFTDTTSEKAIGNIVCSPDFHKTLDAVMDENIDRFMAYQPSSAAYRKILKNTLQPNPKKRWTSEQLHSYVVALCKITSYSNNLKVPEYKIVKPKRLGECVAFLTEPQSQMAKKCFLKLSKDIRTKGICKYHFIAAYQIIQLLVLRNFLNEKEQTEKLVACAALLDALFFDKIHVTSDLCFLNNVDISKVNIWLIKLYTLVEDELYTSPYFDLNLNF